MKRFARWISPAAIVAALASGCDTSGNPGTVPASTDSAATHSFIENPGGVKSKPSSKSKAGELPPQPPK